MAKGQSAVPGYNHNLRHGGRLFHVQTEESSRNIRTHVFLEGLVVASRSTSYVDLLADADLAAKLKKRMQQQHKSVLRQLRDGLLDAQIAAMIAGAPADLAAEPVLAPIPDEPTEPHVFSPTPPVGLPRPGTGSIEPRPTAPQVGIASAARSGEIPPPGGRPLPAPRARAAPVPLFSTPGAPAPPAQPFVPAPVPTTRVPVGAAATILGSPGVARPPLRETAAQGSVAPAREPSNATHITQPMGTANTSIPTVDDLILRWLREEPRLSP